MTSQLIDRGALAAALRRLVLEVGDHESLATYNPDSAQYRQNREQAVKAGPAVDALAAKVATEPALAVFDWTPIRTSPTSTWTGRYFHLARWLLAQARLQDPDVVVERLEQFLTTNAADALEVVPLWGLAPVREIPLPQGICLVPFAEVPATVPKDMLTGIPSARFRDENSFVWAPRPKAALVRRFTHAPIINPAGNQDPMWAEGWGAPDTRANEMLEVARLLTIVRPSAVFPVAHWFQLEGGLPAIGNTGGWGGHEYHRRFVEEVQPGDYDAEDLHALVSQYSALSVSVRSRLLVPLERLRLAFLKVTPVDVALDLGIALEALLTHEQQSDAPISYRVRLRATHLLGGGAAERQATAKRFRIAYKLRSKAAHGGRVDDEALRDAGGAGSVEAYLQECAVLAAQMIRRIIAIGDFPDWEGLAMGWVNPVTEGQGGL